MVDLIIPYYQQKDKLIRALNSICAQTKPRVFIVHVVDDGSEEDVSDIITLFRDKMNLPLKYSKIEHTGSPGLVRQYGIDKALTKYVMFLDSDDILYPYAAKEVSREVLRGTADLIKFDFTCELYDNYTNTGKDNITWLHGCVYRRQFLIDNNIHFSGHVNEDGPYNTQIKFLSDNKIYVDKSIYQWCNNKDSLTRSNSDFLVNTKESFVDNYTDCYRNIIAHMPIDKTDEVWCSDIGLRIAQFFEFYNAALLREKIVDKKFDNSLIMFFNLIREKVEFNNMNVIRGIYRGLEINKSLFPCFKIITIQDFLDEYNIKINISNYINVLGDNNG